MRKGVWAMVLLLCWWVIGPVPLENQVVDGSQSQPGVDHREVLEKKLKRLDSQTAVLGTEPAAEQTAVFGMKPSAEKKKSEAEKKKIVAEKKKSEKAEPKRQKEPEKKKPADTSDRRTVDGKRSALYFHGPRDKKRVALTFDDGPDWRYTSRILDILKREKVRATFFLVGRMAEQRPDLVRRMVREGHVVANHSWNHPNLARLDSRRVRREVDRTNRVIKEITGRSPKLFRAPYGSLDRRVERLIRKRGMIIVHWNVDTRDWDGRSSDRIIRTVRQQAGPGSVILQHTAGRNLDNTVKALPRMIADLKKRGYEMVTVPELLEVPAYEEDAGKRGSLGAVR